MQHTPLPPNRKEHSGSTLPIIYTGADNNPLVEAATRELQQHDADIHYLRTHVTLDFVRARCHRFHQLYFELGQTLAAEQSGYRLFDYYVKHKSTHTYQITFVCRYVGIADIAYPLPLKEGLLHRFLRLVG